MRVVGVLLCLVGLLGPWRLAQANCFDDAAAFHHVNANVLRAIAWIESHNQPAAKHVNENGSIDYGVMQINSIHLRQLSRYGVDASVLMQPCKNVYIAAWHLRNQIVRYGNTWAAVGAYHSATPALRDGYAAQVSRILRGWHLLNAPRTQDVAQVDDDASAPRARRRGTASTDDSAVTLRRVGLTSAAAPSNVE